LLLILQCIDYAMNLRLYLQSRKGRLLQIVAAVAAVILFFTFVSHSQTAAADNTTHSTNAYLEEYGCGVHVEVRLLYPNPQK
jgi:hypothetical protein